MSGDDRLSALADDLLRRILYFVPFKEAASTSVLSRRLDSLWRSSGAVNLDVRIQSEKDFFSHRDAFVRAAKAALDSADARVQRLTLRVDAPDGHDYETHNFLHVHSIADWRTKHDVVGDLVSHPAAEHVEELHVVVVKPMDNVFFRCDEDEPGSSDRSYKLKCLPWKALRLLDLTRCGDLTPPATDALLPRLETLRLRLCSVNSGDLQALIDAAPGLATVHLKSVFFRGSTAGTAEAPGVRLRCRGVTDLLLEFCGMEGQGRCGGGDRGSIDIDAPRLRYFRYKGSQRRFSLTSSAPDMAVLDLSFVELESSYNRQLPNYDQDKTRVLFWQFVRNFTNARVLKLKVNNLKDIAVGKARRTELLCTFYNAVRVELEGAHHPTTSKAAAVGIANLLRCCPAVRDLRLKLSIVPSDSVNDPTYGQTFLERKDRLDYDKSVDRFMRRRLNPLFPLDADDKLDDVPDNIPGLSGHSLTCLQSSLTRVGLQFRMDNSSCFGIRLVKFFTCNAKLLQEICVDSGNRKLCEHMNLNVERWIAPTSSKVCLKRKNLAESSWEFSKILKKSPNSSTDLIGLATNFTILPLER